MQTKADQHLSAEQFLRTVLRLRAPAYYLARCGGGLSFGGIIMKKEFPLLWEKVSVWIAMSLVYFWAIVYAQRAIGYPASEVYAVGMAAFGVTAALSAVCFAMAVAPVSVPASTHAGEKFLHSSILLVQTLLIVSVRDAILQLEFVRNHSFLVGQARGLFAVIFYFVAIAAVWTWYHGFSELNAVLWKNWERRIRQHNEESQRASAIDIGADAAHGGKAEQNAAPDGGKTRAGEH